MQTGSSCYPAQGRYEDRPTGQAALKTYYWRGGTSGAEGYGSLGPEAPPSQLLLSPLQACSSFCFQPQTNPASFSGLLMSAELLLEPSPPSFSEGPQPWAGCQNFAFICSLEPELLSLLKRTVRKCGVYLIMTNSCNLALNC